MVKKPQIVLDVKGCDSDPIFFKNIRSTLQIKPSAEAAYQLGVVKFKEKTLLKL